MHATRHHSSHPQSGGPSRLLSLLGLGTLLWSSWHCVQRTHHRRMAERNEQQPGTLNTWEGEGGRVDPPAGAQFTPTGPG